MYNKLYCTLSVDFSTKEMNNIISGTTQFQQQGPVTCLGMESGNDEARRAYSLKARLSKI